MASKNDTTYLGRKFIEYRGMGMLAMVLTLFECGGKFLEKSFAISPSLPKFTPYEIITTVPEKIGSAADLLPFYQLSKDSELDVMLAYIETKVACTSNPLRNPWLWQYILLQYKKVTGIN